MGHGPCSGQREKSVQRNDPGEKLCVEHLMNQQNYSEAGP